MQEAHHSSFPFMEQRYIYANLAIVTGSVKPVKDVTTYTTPSIKNTLASSKHNQSFLVSTEGLTLEAIGTTTSAVQLSAFASTGGLYRMNSTMRGEGFMSNQTLPVGSGASLIFTTVPAPANPGGLMSLAPTSIRPPGNTMVPHSLLLTIFPPSSNPGGPLSPEPTTTSPPANPGGPISPIPSSILPPSNPGGPLSPAPTQTPASYLKGPLRPVPKILPVYSPEILGNAYGGGFVATPSVFALVFPASTGSPQDVPPAYGYSLQPGQTTVGNSIVWMSTTVPPKDTVTLMPTTPAKDKTATLDKDKTASADSIPTSASIPSVGILTPASNFTGSAPTPNQVQPFEGTAGKLEVGRGMALLGFLGLCFFH